MKKAALNLLIMVIFVCVFGSGGVLAADPNLSLSPASGSYNVGDTFKVTIKIDSAGQVVGAADAVGIFDSAKLEITSIDMAPNMVFNPVGGTGGSCMSSNSADWANGKFMETCYSAMSAGDKAVNGDLAVINFKAKASGTAVVSFTCTGGTADSNIIQSTTVKDVIVCSANRGGTYTINISGDNSETTAENTPTPTTASSTTTTSELPKTGGVGATLGLIIFGAVSFASVVLLKFL